MTNRSITLVTGAARSGKSEWAETLARNTGKTVTYVATAKIDPTDLEWQERIRRHQERRPQEWKSAWASDNLVDIFDRAPASECLLIDSLGTWVASFLDRSDPEWQELTQLLGARLLNCEATVILVAEETGWGVVPAYPLGRLFRDRLGTLTRQIGAVANPVYLVTAGHVLNLSQLGHPLKTRESAG
jgi:adenosylcobinamide kinase / adenosylcobinamide-phosphate guanylyltransferase